MIKRARERKRMSQADLAKALGVSRGAVNSWENDRSRPLSSLGALEEILDIDLTAAPQPVQAAPQPRPYIPPHLQKRIDRLPEEDRDYVMRILTQQDGGAAGEAPA